WVWYERTRPAPVSAPLKEEFEWSFLDLGVGTSSMPYTDVSLKIAGIEVPLGRYEGDCFAVAGSQWPLLDTGLSGAVCEWQNAGQEIGVFEQNGALVLEQGDVAGGDADTPGTRTNFVDLKKQP